MGMPYASLAHHNNVLQLNEGLLFLPVGRKSLLFRTTPDFVAMSKNVTV